MSGARLGVRTTGSGAELNTHAKLPSPVCSPQSTEPSGPEEEGKKTCPDLLLWGPPGSKSCGHTRETAGGAFWKPQSCCRYVHGPPLPAGGPASRTRRGRVGCCTRQAREHSAQPRGALGAGRGEGGKGRREGTRNPLQEASPHPHRGLRLCLPPVSAPPGAPLGPGRRPHLPFPGGATMTPRNKVMPTMAKT